MECLCCGTRCVCVASCAFNVCTVKCVCTVCACMYVSLVHVCDRSVTTLTLCLVPLCGPCPVCFVTREDRSRSASAPMLGTVMTTELVQDGQRMAPKSLPSRSPPTPPFNRHPFLDIKVFSLRQTLWKYVAVCANYIKCVSACMCVSTHFVCLCPSLMHFVCLRPQSASYFNVCFVANFSFVGGKKTNCWNMLPHPQTLLDFWMN